jgi:Xaa-Pro aminopeptidase
MRNPEYAPFPTDEYLARYHKAQKLMGERGIDALVLTSEENGTYFSGLETIEWSAERPIGILLPRDKNLGPIMSFAGLLGDIATASSWIEDLCPWGPWGGLTNAPANGVEAITRSVRKLGLEKGTLGVELGHAQKMLLSHANYSELVSSLPEAKFVDAADLLWDLRKIKSPREIEVMRRVCAATTKAFEVGFAAMREGMTEKELAGIMFAQMASETQELPSFMMIRSGPSKYGMVNVKPFHKTLNRGDLVIVDAGARYKSYCSDFMRMASIGEPTDEQRRMFEANLEAQKAGVAAIKPGATTGQIFDACYQVLAKHGLAEHFTTAGVGHSVGLFFHEPPRINKGGNIPVEANMVLTVEPIWYDRPDHQIGNFAVEDMVLVTETGGEILSLYPKDLHVIET